MVVFYQRACLSFLKLKHCTSLCVCQNYTFMEQSLRSSSGRKLKLRCFSHLTCLTQSYKRSHFLNCNIFSSSSLLPVALLHCILLSPAYCFSPISTPQSRGVRICPHHSHLYVIRSYSVGDDLEHRRHTLYVY